MRRENKPHVHQFFTI